MNNKSVNTIQLTLGQNKCTVPQKTTRPIQVNTWVNSALAKKQVPSIQEVPSQIVEVHFAFSKSILERR